MKKKIKLSGVLICKCQIPFMLSLLVGMRRSAAAAAAPTLSVIGQRLIDAANHLIRPVSMETRSGADVQEEVGWGGVCLCVYSTSCSNCTAEQCLYWFREIH